MIDPARKEVNDMIRTNVKQPTETRKLIARKGCFSLVEYEKDYSVTPGSAAEAFYESEMNIHKKQVIAELDGNGIILQGGEMQIMMGDIKASTNVQGVGDYFKKLIGSTVTGETAIKPRYTGTGVVLLEPTYKYVLFEDVADWNGGMVIEDGMFLACDDTVQMKVVARTTFSSALLGNEGLFNTMLSGTGIAVLESPVPAQELIIVDLEDDEVRIDGRMAIAWSDTLRFTVERTTRTLIGSAASGEGLVNVYRGTGRVLIAPVACDTGVPRPKRRGRK